MKLMSDGFHRHCTARCYNAKGERCTCICEGINHGIGLSEALKKMDLLIEVLEEKDADKEKL